MRTGPERPRLQLMQVCCYEPFVFLEVITFEEVEGACCICKRHAKNHIHGCTLYIWDMTQKPLTCIHHILNLINWIDSKQQMAENEQQWHLASHGHHKELHPSHLQACLSALRSAAGGWNFAFWLCVNSGSVGRRPFPTFHSHLWPRFHGILKKKKSYWVKQIQDIQEHFETIFSTCIRRRFTTAPVSICAG